MSDEELLKEPCDSRPTLSEEAGIELFDSSITRWTDDTVRKMIYGHWPSLPTIPEAYAMEIVHHHTTIPVPRVRRVIVQKDGLSCIFMDYIPGRQLVHVWPSLSLFGKLRVVFLLRRYIRQLRAVRHPRSVVPGAPLPGLEAAAAETFVHGDVRPIRGPFRTYAEYAAFWNDRHRMGKMPNATMEEASAVLEPFDDSEPLVLTHGDIHMWNILVGDDGRLWILDWGVAGFYPPWFEFVGLRKHNRFERDMKRDTAGWLWRLSIPFICHGPYYKQEYWWMTMGPGLYFK
ncbi:kinase-like domain-containing protein [Trametes gibbosa]|nr:kinase-like domain-containing protein [Trametes gibbosa]